MLRLPAKAPQPTIVQMRLTKEQFEALNDWLGKDRLFIVEEPSGSLCPGQLNSISMFGAPGGLNEEYGLFFLLNQITVENPDQPLIFRLEKVKENLVSADEWTAGDKRRLDGVSIDKQAENARLVVRMNGRLFTRYLYSADLMKPYFYPLIGPAHKTLIQDGPDDHLHHHGLWWGHDQVNGHKLYHEFGGEGRQVHREFLTLFGGPVMGQITARIDWMTNGGERLLQEIRTMRLYNLPETSRYVDVSSQLFATEGDVVFGDTKEGGFPFIRVNEQINGYHTGQITSSTGESGERRLFGKEADWVDYSGKIYVSPEKGFVEAGISLFVHPRYRDYSSRWFVRDYGPFTSSNFHFYGGYTLKAHRSITFCHRIYLHEGSAITGKVKERYREYACPVEAEWV